jgi:phenylacetate-CoA ligase
MVSTQFRKEHLILDMTGGSTGSPMQFYYDRNRHDSREAATLRHDRWTGWNIGDRRAILWGAPQDVKLASGWKSRARELLIDRRIILDASSIDEAAMSAFHHRLIGYKPVVIQAYANTIGLFARYLQSNRGAAIRPKGIITSAELLTAENRQLIEEVFACPVYNRYGSREMGVIASECEMHQGLHVNAENLIVEVLADGRSSKDADGEIVVTDLRNLAMPLIRYRIRDVGRIKARSCGCPRGLPLLELSGGRVTDFLIATNGSKVSGIVVATYVITNLSGIRQIQFVQSERGAVDVNLVRGSGWSDHTAKELTQRIRRFLGSDMLLQMHFLTEIPSAPSGKYRFSISLIDDLNAAGL